MGIIRPVPPSIKSSIMKPEETIVVETNETACDGGGGALGHPKVYLTLDEEGGKDCPYCGQRFELKEGAAPAAAH